MERRLMAQAGIDDLHTDLVGCRSGLGLMNMVMLQQNLFDQQGILQIETAEGVAQAAAGELFYPL